MVIRDGSITYRSAINDAHPNAIQVNDRFHIIKNLVKSITKALQRIIIGRIEIPLTSDEAKLRYEYLMGLTRREKIIEAKRLRGKGSSYSEIAKKLQVSETTASKYVKTKDNEISKEHISKREKEHIDAVEKVKSKVEKIQQLHNQGLTIEEMAKATGYSLSSITEYLSKDFNPVHGQYGVSRIGLLSPYRDEILTLRAKGVTYKRIVDKLKLKGYTGSVAALRGFVAKEKRITKDLLANQEPSELIDKRWVTQLLYNPTEKSKKITQEQLDEVVKRYPIFSGMFEILSDFRSILSNKKSSKLSEWIKKARSLEVNEINSFISGLLGDYDSIVNAINYTYNNGLAEGSVNKLKVIKRIMYGRNNFELLRCKVLQLEQLKRGKKIQA
jgi:transposase